MNKRILGGLAAAVMLTGGLALTQPPVMALSPAWVDVGWTNDMNEASYWNSYFGTDSRRVSCTKYENHNGNIPAQYDAAVTKKGSDVVRVYSDLTKTGSFQATHPRGEPPMSWVMECTFQPSATTRTTTVIDCKAVTRTDTNYSTPLVYRDGNWVPGAEVQVGSPTTREATVNELNKTGCPPTEQPPAKVVPGEWVDDKFKCGEPKVERTRIVVTTPYIWHAETRSWVLDLDGATRESELGDARELTEQERQDACVKPADLVKDDEVRYDEITCDSKRFITRQTKSTTPYVWNAEVGKYVAGRTVETENVSDRPLSSDELAAQKAKCTVVVLPPAEPPTEVVVLPPAEPPTDVVVLPPAEPPTEGVVLPPAQTPTEVVVAQLPPAQTPTEVVVAALPPAQTATATAPALVPVVPAGGLPATGSNGTGVAALIALLVTSLGGAALLAARRRNVTT